MTTRQSGFTLIELMIVIAIVAILAAIAIPLYLSYVTRAQASEALTLGSGVEPHVAEYYNTHGRLPSAAPANASVGLPAPASIRGRYVASIEVQGGQIVATFSTAANRELAGKVLILSPVPSGSRIVWQCKVTDASIYRLLPSECRHGG